MAMRKRRLIEVRAVAKGMKPLRATALVFGVALCLTGAAGCLMPAVAESANADNFKPTQSYKMSPSESSAWPYYDARVEIERYAGVAYESYQAASEAGHELQDAVSALLDEPTDATLAAARGAWLKVRAAYMATEGFRFYGGPIDGAALARIDPWPIDEGFIDGVDGKRDGGLIGDPKIAITRQTLSHPPGSNDATHAATGFHVIEFLLWGQDKNPGAPAGRLPADFQLGGAHHADRRRLVLQTATKLLVEDLDLLTAAWAPRVKGNYAEAFLALDPREALGRMLAGMAILSDQAIARERLLGVLDDRIRAKPLGRYSLHTNDDLTADLDGIRILWTGDDRQSFGTGLDGLVQSLDPALAQQMERRLAAAQAALRLLDKPFDHLLSVPPDSDGWKHVDGAAVAFHRLARTIQEVGKLLAVSVPMSAP
jgi:putative iron-regulated protein